MKRSNTANVDPRTINFADVKRRLEDKIDRINSYQSKRGTLREAPGGATAPSFLQSRQQEDNPSRFAQEPSQSNTSFDSNPNRFSQSPFSETRSQGLPQSNLPLSSNSMGQANRNLSPNANNYEPLGQGSMGMTNQGRGVNSQDDYGSGNNLPFSEGRFSEGRNLADNNYSTPRQFGMDTDANRPLWNQGARGGYSQGNYSQESRNPGEYNQEYYGQDTSHRRGAFDQPSNYPQNELTRHDSQGGSTQITLDNPAGESRYGQNSSNIHIGGPSLAGYHGEGRIPDNKENYYDIHKKLDFLEQERLNDLRTRADDSKISYLANSLEKIEGKLENLQNSSVTSNLASPVDVSLEIIQRKLDKLEQDRIDSLRSKIEQERARELEKSIEKLGSKIEDSYVSGNTLYNKAPSDLIDLIQRKIDKLEQDKLDALKERLEEDRSSEIARNLEKIESKLAASVDKSVIDKTAYLDAVSKEDLLRKIDKLEQDRINDIKSLMDQEKIFLLNKQIEKLESKIEQALGQSMTEKSAIDASSEIARKLERLEQEKNDEIRARREEEKLLALSRSLSNIESKLGEKQEVLARPPSVMENFLRNIAERLERLEQKKHYDNDRPLIEPSHLERSLSNLESKIERLSYPDVTSQIDSRYASILEGIERKLERLERDKVDEYREKTEDSKLSNLTRSLERIEDSLVSGRAPYSTGVEGYGLGKKLDKLEQDRIEDLRSSLDREKLSHLQKSLDKIEDKLNFPSVVTSPPIASPDLSNAFIELSKRLDNLEKKRLEDYALKANSSTDTKLATILENIDNKLNRSLESNFNQTNKRSDFILEEIQRKIHKLEDSKSKDSLLNTERDKFSKLSNDVEKLDSKINNLVLDNNKNSSSSEVSQLVEKIAKIEQSKLEEAKEKQNLERFSNLSQSMEKLDSKINNLALGNNKNSSSSEVSQLVEKIAKIEQSKLEEAKEKQNLERFSNLSQSMEKLDSKINNLALGSNKNYPSNEVAQLAEKIAKIEQNRLEEIKDRQNLDRFANINSKLEKIETKLSSEISSFNKPLQNINGLEELHRKLDKQQEKISELHSKLEQEKFESLNRHLFKLEQKIDSKESVNKDVNNPILWEIKNKLDSLNSKVNENPTAKDINNPILLEIKNKLDNLNPKDNDVYVGILADIKNKLNNLDSHKGDTKDLLLEDIKNRLDNLNSKVNENPTAKDTNNPILLEIKDKLNNLNSQNTDANSLILGDLKHTLEDLKSQNNDITHNNLLENIKSRLDNLNSQKNDINSSLLLELKDKLSNLNSKDTDTINLTLKELKHTLEDLKSQNNDVANNAVLVDIKNIKDKLDNLSSQKNDTNNPILLEIKDRLNNLNTKDTDVVNLTLKELKHTLEDLKSQNNGIPQNNLLENIKSRLDNIDSHKGDAKDLLLEDIKNRLDNLNSKVNENSSAKDSEATNLALGELKKTLEDLKSQNNDIVQNSLLENIKGRLDNIEDTKNSESSQNVILADIKNIKDKLDNLSSQKNDINSSLLLELKDRLNNLNSKVNENSSAKGSEATNLALGELKKTLEDLKTQNNDIVQNSLLENIKGRLDNIEDTKNSESSQNVILADIKNIKDKLDNLSSQNNNIEVAVPGNSKVADRTRESLVVNKEVQPLVDNKVFLSENNKEDNTLVKHIISKNSEILEDIHSYLQKLNREIGNLSSSVTTSNDGNSQEVWVELQNKYINAVEKIESSLKKVYENESEIKKHILEQDLVDSEISKLKNQLNNEKDMAQRAFLTKEINKLKSYIDNNKGNLSTEGTLILDDIRNQQEIIRKSLEMMPYIAAGEKEYPLIEDIRNLLSEVNYRNKVLNDNVNNDRNNLINVIHKVDTLFSSITKIEEVINKISNNEGLNEGYKQSLEENFTKLKEDNFKIIEVLKSNNKKSSLLSEKADILIKSLREDILSIAKLEQTSILEEFSNLRAIILEFKNFIKNQEEDKGNVRISLSKLVSNLDNITNLQEETLNYFKDLDSNIENNLSNLRKNSTQGNNNLLSEIKLYLEDSKNRAQYFNQLKDKIDKNSLVINEFLSKSNGVDKGIVGFAEGFKITLESLHKAIALMVEAHNKQNGELHNLINKTDKLLESGDIKDKPKDIPPGQKEIVKTVPIEDKSKDTQSAIVNKSDSLQSNFNETQEKAINLIKEVAKESADKVTNKVVNPPKDIDIESQSDDDIPISKIKDLQQELSSMDFNIKTLSEKVEDIKIEVKDSKFYLEKDSGLSKFILSSADEVDFDDTLKNMSEEVSIIDNKLKDMEDLILDFQKEIQSNLSPYVEDKNFAENFNKFTDFNLVNMKNLKDNIKSFNNNINIYLVEDKIITNEQLVELLTTFEEVMNFQDNFLKVYSLNSNNLMNFAKKAEKSISQVDVKKADKIHSKLRQSIADISLKDKRKELSNIVSTNNAKNSKKVDLLANMDYLNKEITKKTSG